MAPFDFAKSLDYLRQFPPPALDLAVTDNSFIKAFRIQGQTLLASVSVSPFMDRPGVEYELYSSRRVSNELELALGERLCSFLSLDDDLGQFYSLADNDPQFEPVGSSFIWLSPGEVPKSLRSSCLGNPQPAEPLDHREEHVS